MSSCPSCGVVLANPKKCGVCDWSATQPEKAKPATSAHKEFEQGKYFYGPRSDAMAQKVRDTINKLKNSNLFIPLPYDKNKMYAHEEEAVTRHEIFPGQITDADKRLKTFLDCNDEELTKLANEAYREMNDE